MKKNSIIKEKSKRIKVVKEIVDNIHKKFNVQNVKDTSVKSLGKLMGADRCFIADYDPLTKKFSKVTTEYTSSKDVLSLRGDLPTVQATRLTDICINSKILKISNTSKYILDNSLQDTLVESFYQKYNIKSVLAIPIRHSGKVLGALALQYTQQTRNFSDDDVQFVTEIADSIGSAIYQSNLYEEAKTQAERERTTRKVFEIIRSSLDLNDILTNVVEELLNYFGDVQRIYVGQINFRLKENFVEITRNEKIKKFSLSEGEYFEDAVSYWLDYIYKYKTKKIIDNIEQSDMPSEIKKIYENMGVKSIIMLPIKSKEDIWGSLFLSSIENHKKWSEDEIVFLESIVVQLDVAIKQSELYADQKARAQREFLLREVIEAIRISIDLEQILTIVCDEVAKIFKVQRATIVEFCDTQDFTCWKTRREYKERSDIKGLKDIYYDKKVGAYNGKVVLGEGENLVINNIEESDTPDFYKKTYIELGVKSILSVPIASGDEKFGIIFLSSVDNYKNWSKEEVLLLESIASQVYVAIRQSELFNSISMANKRNNDILNTIPFMVWLKDENGRFIAVNEMFAKMAKTNVDNIIGKTDADFWPGPLGESYLRDDLQVMKSRQKKNIEEAIEGPDGIRWHETSKSPVFDDKGNVIGTAGIARDITKRKEDEIKIKQNAQREALLRKIIEIIRSSIDIDIIKHEIVNQVGILLKADRVAFADYDIEEGRYFTLPSNEYRSSPEVKTFVGVDFVSIPGFIESIKEKHVRGEDIIFNDLDKYLEEKNLVGSGIEKFYRDMGFMSSMAINIYHRDLFFGDLVITFEQKRDISQVDIELIKTITNQAGIAIYQSTLYENEKHALERERIIKKSITFIRSTLDVKKIKKTFITVISQYLDSDFNVFYEFDTKTRKFLEVDKDSFYLSSLDVKNPEGLNIIEDYGWGDFFRKETLEVVYSDVDDFKKDYNLYGTLGEEFLNEYNIKSCIVIPVLYKNNLLGVLGINYTKKYKKIIEDDINFVRTLANQAGIAFHQAELTNQQRKSLEKEFLLKQITDTIRSTLDIKQVKKRVVESIGKAFDADICILIEAESYTNKLFVLDEFSEYRSSDDIFSLVGIDFEQEQQIKLMKDMNKELKELFIPDVDEFIKENKLQDSLEEDFFKESGIKTALGMSLFYKSDFIGILGVYFVKEKKYFLEEDLNFARILAIQAGNALNQSRLYEFQRKIAYKESVLKDIISEIKLTRDLNHAYNKLLKKLADIFNLNRTLFLESSKINPDELEIKYEYVIDRKDLSVNNLIFPQVCIDEFLNLIHKLEPLIINDVSRCYPEHTSDFFEKYKIKALISLPLVKYNGEAKVLGFLLLCSESIRTWTEEEVDLIKSISDSVVSVIWEISKFIETEELRNSFVLTLAHDFQVPLVGERTAIEYLLEYSECSFGNNREILQEILENNQNIAALLDKSVDIYNYESGKKKLDLEKIKVSQILNEAIFLAKSQSKLDVVKINLKPIEEDFSIKIDKQEILKVLAVLLDNAIVHSTEGKEVTIDCFKSNNKIIISVHNMGKPIPHEIQEKLFNRYEMALAIERKIGAGTGLFLSKRIIEAHKGYIWFDTSKAHGTTFYISLPIK